MVGVGIGFKGRNIRAQKWAEKFAARRVVEINEGTRAGLAALIRRSIREGISPYDTGRLIRPMIGLTERSAMAVMNYRKGLMDAGGSMAVVDRAVERYAAKKLRERAMTIARNEAMLALNTSAAQEAKEAVRDGRLGKYMVKVWLVTPDELLCPICAPLEGTTTPADESFPDGDPPIHVICRCTFGLQPGETQFGEVTRTAPMPIDGMERVGNATGANAGGIYKDLTGQRWYVKKAGRGGEEYARNEVLANRLYRETGLNVPDVRLATLDGDIGVASKIVELSSEKVTAARLIAYKEARGGFAVDVLLGNFDVVGTGYSNMAITKAGRILRVDAGGSLAFWGEGTRKGALWGASVEREMAIMQIKDAIGFEAGSVFGGMTRAEVIASMKRVEDLSESAIRRLVAEFGPLDEKAATAMIDTLLARRADILSRRVVLKLEEKASSP